MKYNIFDNGILLALCFVILFATASAPIARGDGVNILVLVPQNYGANFNLYMDNFELNGWNVILAGTEEIVVPCPAFASSRGCLPVTMDYLTSDIDDVTMFDGVAIMSGSAYAGSACQDLIVDGATLELIRTADESGLAVGGWCTGVRVLAAADVINGLQVTGNPTYQSEYINAGATFVGSGIPPVTDGNIMTCSKGDYYNIQNTNAFAILVDDCRESIRKIRKPWKRCGHVTGKNGGDLVWDIIFESNGSEGLQAVYRPDNGGMVLTGYSYSGSAGFSDVLVMKTDDLGNEEWSVTVGGAKDDRAFDVCGTADGSYMIVGYTHSFGAGSWDVYAMKLDTDGNVIWTRTYGGAGIDVATSCITTSDGNNVICGYTESEAVGEDDIYIMKIDPDGSEIWSRTIGGTDTDMGHDILEVSDGGLVLAGSTGLHTPLGTRYMYVIKTDSEGIIQWSQRFTPSPGVAYSSANSIARTEDGGYIVAGDADDLNLPDLRGIILAKLQENGTVEWNRRFGRGSYYDSGWDVAIPNDGGFLLVGASKNASTITSDSYILRTDDLGNRIWNTIIGGDGTQWANAVSIADRGFIITGHSGPDFGGPYHAHLMKISSLFPRFEAEPCTGHAPLQTQFTDASLGESTVWTWDLDGDGATDSNEQNPDWIYQEPGTYAVRLIIADGECSDTLYQDQYIHAFDGNSGIMFDGNEGYVTCAASPSINLTEAVTVEAWMYPYGWGEVTGLGYGRIVDKGSFALALHGEGAIYDDHALLFILKNESGPPRVASTPLNSIRLDGWQHIAATYDGETSLASIYINGISQDLTFSATPSGVLRDNETVDLLFGNNDGGMYTFNGILDEVRLWSTSRTGDEIRRTMQDSLIGNEDGLVGYWPMEEGSGTTTRDDSPNGNDGVITMAYYRQGTPFIPTVRCEDEIIFSLPEIPMLEPMFPNPFSSGTAIRYILPAANHTTITIHDCLGRQVRILKDESHEAGAYSIIWDGMDDSGTPVSSGLYFCSLRSGSISDTRKCVLIR